MADHFVGSLSDLDDPSIRVFDIGGREIGLARKGNEVRAYENRCLHQGGPVCDGRIIGKVEAVLAADKTTRGERFSDTEIHIVCPWHGYEYDLLTGRCAADSRLRLRSFPVSVVDDDVYVRIADE